MDSLSFLSDYGFRYKSVPVSRLHDLEKEYMSTLKNNGFDGKLYEKSISRLSFNIPENFPGAESIVIIAVPSYRSEACFRYSGKDYQLTIPPTYIGYNDTPGEVQKIISESLNPIDYKFVKTVLPLKILAVHSGLAYYGRNNITYIEGLGSFYQLVSFFSNMPAEDHDWYGLRMLGRCEHCSACVKVCPTGTINDDRFLIKAERCITFFNENGYEFPEWMNAEAHNSLIGCMLCQYICPENKKIRDFVDHKTWFTEKETDDILKADKLDDLDNEARTKLMSLDLIDTHTDFNTLKRNLIILLNKN